MSCKSGVKGRRSDGEREDGDCDEVMLAGIAPR